MYITHFLYLILTLTNVYAFMHNPLFAIHNHKLKLNAASMDMSNDYLDNINKYTGFLDATEKKQDHNPNIKKLEGIRKNITNYIKSQKDDNTKKIEPGFRSTYRPIPKATFDTIFMNINQIKQIYISYNVDRIIFEMLDKRRYVYYIDNKNEYKKMEQLMKLIPSQYKTIIINDVGKTMDDPFGYLYCDTK